MLGCYVFLHFFIHSNFCSLPMVHEDSMVHGTCWLTKGKIKEGSSRLCVQDCILETIGLKIHREEVPIAYAEQLRKK